MASSSLRTPSQARTSSIEKALEECDIACVPEFTKNTNTTVKKQCSKDLVSRKKCYIDNEKTAYIYNTIDWNTLYTNLDKYMSFFVRELMNDKILRDKLRGIYTYGPTEDTSDDKYAEIIYTILQNDDARRCQNIIVKISINRGSKSKGGKTKQSIAHISLHPPMSKFYRNSTRSRSGCGYMCRDCESNTNTNTTTDDSPFHYVIDTVRWGDKEFHSDNPLRPELSFKIEERSGSGRFLQMTKADRFVQLDSDDFPYKGGEREANLDDDLNELHRAIYNKFVDTWNITMLGGSTDPDTKEVLPSIRKGSGSGTAGAGSGTAGGRRKTRRVRNKRHRTRKH